MKKDKTILLATALLLLTVSMTFTSVQAKPFIKEVITEIVDGPFPPDDPSAGAYGKGVVHQTMIIKDFNIEEGTIEVTMQMVWVIRLYAMIPTNDGYEIGELLALLKMTRIYTGTLVPGVPEGGMMTGTLVEDWVINVFADIPSDGDGPFGGDLRGHWVTLYKDGEVVKKIGFGESPFGD